MNLTEKEKKIAQGIWEYYRSKDSKESDLEVLYDNVNREVMSLGISSIKEQGDDIAITLSRPGLLIGSQGKNIEALLSYIQKENPLYTIKKIKIIEDRLPDYLYHYFYLGEEDY